MKLSHTIDIFATPAQVFFWLEDPDRAVQWMTSVTQTEIFHRTSNRIGTTFRETVTENGRSTELRGVITDFSQNKRLGFFLEGDFNTVQVEFVLQQMGTFTRLTQTAAVHFKGFLRLISLFWGPRFKRSILSQMQEELEALKLVCEQVKNGELNNGETMTLTFDVNAS
ncbi:MAG: SRPBCC family protein [Ardenticatenaceae bacterium]|nr:SRPBCC family protein [Ardenticatenaceae bacterium]